MKTDFCSLDVIEIAVSLAVVTFNSGQEALNGLFAQLGYRYTPTVAQFLRSKDDMRIWIVQEYGAKELEKKRRQQMRLDRVSLEEQQKEAEGVTYHSGGF